MSLLDQLKTLTQMGGPSGLETSIAATVLDLWQPLVDSAEIDHMGNVIAVKHGSGDLPRKRLMVTAHMDELGLMVHSIETFNGYGFLRVLPLGGVDIRQLIGQRVTVHGTKPLIGVVGALPQSMLPDDKRGRAYDYEALLVDVGLSAETTQATVSVGDFITFNQPVHQLMNGRIATKAIDNRACVAALTEALRYLQTRDHSWDVVFAATIQEETRLLGGFLTAFSQKPDVAISLDVSHAKQPGVSEPGSYALGSGPILDIGVNIHPGMLAELRKAADALEMKVNLLTHTRSSGTETSAIQLTEAGIPTALISVAIRNMHTMVESVSLKDISRAGRLTGEFAARLNDTFLDKLHESLFI